MKPDRIFRLAAAVCVALVPLLAFADPVPSYLRLPPGYGFGSMVYHRYDRLSVDIPARSDIGQQAQHIDARGRYWRVQMTGNLRAFNVALWRPVLERAGWQMVVATSRLLARHDTPSGPAWLVYTGAQFFELLETGPGATVTLPQPGETPETLVEGHDIPYLLPLPGMTLVSSHTADWTEEMTGPLTGGPLFVGPPSHRAMYRGSRDIGGVEVQSAYSAAFVAAGWTINVSRVGGLTTAHYAQQGRDIWAGVRGTDGGELYITVVDVGANVAAARLRAAIDRDGHVALYGIYFDVDREVVRPDSEATLRQILALLHDVPGLQLEIQGHTDNSGTPAHNQHLSEARAASVRQWLTAHGIAAARLTSAGYGERVPIADNRSEHGRALNRRVEIARRTR